MKNKSYYKKLGEFRKELREEIPRPVLKDLHKAVWWKHFAIVLRQLLIGGFAIYFILNFNTLWIWLPASFVLGFIIFDFTVLLHEVVHHAVFEKRRPRLEAILGWLYALPSGISRTQFTRWHLDHHDELGHESDDPKRAHLTPKIVKRWYKFLYMTPTLFPIYFRAAAKEAENYSPELQKQVQFERKITIALHVAVMFYLIVITGLWGFFKVYAVPYFFVFPIAFTINRVGQHYNINPDDVAQWSTLMKGSWFWDFVYLNSNYHLEHHYFPAVPCYNLPRLQKALQSLYERHGMKGYTYGEVLYGWFVRNHTPHTNWELVETQPSVSRPSDSVAFTLIELLIVVAIIGILAAIAVPNFLNAQIRAKIARCEADLNACRTAIYMYKADHNAYPPITQMPGYQIPKNLTTPTPYIASIPKDTFPQDENDLYFQYGTSDDYYFATAAYFAKHNFPWKVQEGGHVFEFNLMGRGPDGDWADAATGAKEVDEPLKWRYDPSNGLVSSGNIPYPGP